MMQAFVCGKRTSIHGRAPSVGCRHVTMFARRQSFSIRCPQTKSSISKARSLRSLESKTL